jgi:hypothetical protein
MADETARFGLPFQEHDDAPAGYLDNQDLAEEIEARLGYAGAQGGKSIVPGAQGRTNAAYGLLGTPDRVPGLVLPDDDDLIFVYFHALLLAPSGSGQVGSAAIFIEGNQLKADDGDGAPAVQEASVNGSSLTEAYQVVTTTPRGLAIGVLNSNTDVSNVATGMALAGEAAIGGGRLAIMGLPAGTYDITVQFKASAGTVTAKERKLYAWTKEFPTSGV